MVRRLLRHNLSPDSCLTNNVHTQIVFLSNVGPVCNETDIRLVNGSTPASGTLEICLGGQWGLICDDSWDTSDAAVVCRQLGLPPIGLS